MLRRVLLMIVIVIWWPSSGHALATNSDDCLSGFSDFLNHSGLPAEGTIEILGCREVAGDGWRSATILDARPQVQKIPINYMTTVTSVREIITSDLKAMLSDTRLTQWFTYDLVTGEFTSPALTTGTDYAQGKVFHQSLRGELFEATPNWAKGIRRGYEAAASSYLLDPSNIRLGSYVSWYMNRRDSAILGLTSYLGPMIASGMQSAWGMNTIPWPWQLADNYTINEFALWLIATGRISVEEPTPTPANAASVGNDVPHVWLSIYAVSDTGKPLTGACFEIVGPTPAGRPSPHKVVCDGDPEDAPGTPGVVTVTIVAGHYLVSETKAPEGYQLDSVVQDFWTETDRSPTNLRFLHHPSTN